MQAQITALLLNTDGTHRKVKVRLAADYRRAVGGKVEMLATRSSLVCYVRRDSHTGDDLPNNEYSPLLRAMGFEPESVGGGHRVVGNALLCSSSRTGNDESVTREVMDMVLAYDRAKDKALFLLEVCNKRDALSDSEEEESDESSQ